MHTAIPTGQPGRTDLSAQFSRVLRRILALDAAYRDARRLAEAPIERLLDMGIRKSETKLQVRHLFDDRRRNNAA